MVIHMAQPGLVTDPETVRTLQSLLAVALRGGVIGMAAVTFCQRREFETVICGYAQTEPLRTLGALHVLKADVLETVGK